MVISKGLTISKILPVLTATKRQNANINNFSAVSKDNYNFFEARILTFYLPLPTLVVK